MSRDTIIAVGDIPPTVKSALQKFGYTLKQYDPAQALPSYFDHELIDLVICNEAPPMPLPHLVDYLRTEERSRKVPIVILSETKPTAIGSQEGIEVVSPTASIGRLMSRIATQLRLRKIAGNSAGAGLAEMVAAQRDLADRLKKELDEARGIQQSLLPQKLPGSAHFSVAAVYEPVEQVGGDWYTACEEDDGSISVQVADVTGHGLPAAFIGSMTKLAFQAAGIVDPGKRLARMNTLMTPMLPEGRFVTLLAFHYIPTTGVLSVARAGHPPPLIYSKRTGAISSVVPDGFPIGFFDLGDYDVATVTLEPGDMVLAYTDGISEAQDRNFEMFGVERLSRSFAESAASGNAGRAIEQLLERFEQFTDGRRLIDDLTLVAIERKE
jgi:serine phosphatase RsbU (regulator of sigma subunit)